MASPVLETKRLLLRVPTADDFEGFKLLHGDPEASRFLGGIQHPSVVWRQMRTLVGAWMLDGFAMFSVIEKSSNRWVGRLGPWQPEGWPGTEVGWGLIREAWGQGYATEGATAAIDWAFEHLGWTEVIHSIDPSNAGSIKVAERLGSRYLRPGRLPPPYDKVEMGLWGQSKEEWRERRAMGHT
jgi:RimJ/RimL family protein N-acetyltransferase